MECSGRDGTPAESSGTGRERLTIPASVGDEGRSLLEAMDDEATVHVDELAERLDWDVSRVSRVLLVLEMEGLVYQWPGMRYSKQGR